jgi:superfamily II DNA or RNA helicase|tara:strand:- start:153 stop:1670 length:1518 start_codon:yes stop_codon:yes gene_type:complete
MSDLVVSYKDSVYISVDCDKGIAQELSEYFTFKVPGYQFMPTYRNKMWDGTIKLYNIYKQELYAGLEDYVKSFAKERNYSISFNAPLVPKNDILKEEVEEYINDTLQPAFKDEILKAYEHQVDAVHHALNNNRCLLLSPTASGKSLIIYSLIRKYMEMLPEDKKILIVVPTVSLVTQMYEDFKEYSKADRSFDVAKECHTVFSGQEKINNSKIIISTWQSIYKCGQKYFDNFGAVFGDECHLFKSKSLTSIMSKLKSCPYRIGTTGTLDGTQTHKLVIEGLFGSVYDVIKTNELMDKDLLAKLSIECILLKYTDKTRKELKRSKYFNELEWLVTNPQRNNFIANLAKNLNGNTLVLFQLVEKHGKKLVKLIEQICPDHDVHFVYGGTDAEDREKVRNLTEENDNAIIVASYGTFSTGVSIRRLHNIIFASPSKSRVRVLQSIGRQLRKSKYKEKARLYDIGDDLSWKTWTNHTLKHFVERMKIYNKERFEYKTVKINLEEGEANG